MNRSIPTTKRYSAIAAVLAIALVSCGKESSYVSCTSCTIFVSSRTNTGDLFSSSNPGGGQSERGHLAADGLCNIDANRPSTERYYKALIGSVVSSDVVRGAPTTSWPLKASTEYIRADGTVIGTTTSGAVFSFPLTNSIAASGSASVWTSLSTSWVSNAGCGDAWNSRSSSSSASVGDPTSTTATAVSNGTSTCDTSHAFYCVEL